MDENYIIGTEEYPFVFEIFISDILQPKHLLVSPQMCHFLFNFLKKF